MLRIRLVVSFFVALRTFAAGTFIAGTFATSSLARAEDRPRDEAVKFNRDVRPILSDLCFQCHGPDEQKRQGGLRLDLADAARKGGESGPAFVAGQPNDSELIRRITSTDPDTQMPPPSSGKTLQPQQVETLRRWIAQGAEYQGHWAFLRIERPQLPTGTSPANSPAGAAVANPIDAFIHARLQKEGLTPSPEASRETLIRRVTLDLTGLPATPAEVDAFLADQSPEAYERVVDRLFASPHYGERMAQQWLDFARYADSNGFQTDSSRQMWGWRDWVINAYNRNLPFDRFTVEQLAGDMLPNPSLDQIVATGFNRNTRLNGEGGRIVEEWFVETVIDRVETTGLTWMGLTLNCCRCHDHKYDPISQKEFYQLFAFFNSIDESGVLDSEGGGRGGGNSRPVVPMPAPTQESELSRLREAVKTAEARRDQMRQSSPNRQADWEVAFAKQLSTGTTAWRQLEPTSVKSEGGATFTRQDDASWLASGKNPDNDVYTITAPWPAGSFTAVLLEAFPDASLPNQSLGRYPNGNFVLTDVDAQITAPSLTEPLVAMFTRAEADYEQNGWPVRSIVDDKPQRKRGQKNQKGWAVDGPTKRDPRKAMFIAAAPLTVPENATLTITLRHDAITGHNIGRLRLSASSLPAAALKLDGSAVPESLRQALLTAADQRSPAQRDVIAKFYRESGDAELKQAEQAVANAKKAVSDFEDNVATVMVMKERPQPRDAFLLVRGQYDRPGDKVGRGLPAVFPPLPEGAPLDRLGFAQWLVSRDHPLTARVWVNRAWERFFGTGLVKTSENLGSQSEWPSHPELLDWLAVEFMEPTVLPKVAGEPTGPWNMKALQKLIVMSATYRQSARVTPELMRRDPDNRLLARGPRFRLSAEMVRDQALAASGLLVSKIGGPSVRPYMPDGVWDETSRYGDLRNYKPDGGDGLYRRSLYTIWKRTAAPPSMMLFDAPNREVCTVKRSRTNTPLQALSLMNEITFVEAARKLAERMMVEGGSSPAERLAYGFRLVTARRPSATELSVLTEGLTADVERFRARPEAAAQLTSFGMSKPARPLDAVEWAAYTLTANVLLNLDEVVTRE